MEVLFFWLLTIIISMGMKVSVAFMIFKDIADAGYKINLERLKEIQENMDLSRSNSLLSLVPIINIMQSLKISSNYINQRYHLLDALNVMDVLEEMTDIEKEEYLKKPTGLNALFLNAKIEVRLAHAHKIELNNEFLKGEIYYELDKTGEIIILKSTGNLSNLNIDEQKEIVLDKLLEQRFNRNIGMDKTGEKFLEESNDNKEEVDSKTLNNNKNGIEQKKRELQDLKNALLEKQKEQNKDEGPKLTKKK